MAIERHGTTQRYSDICAYGNTIYLVETPQTLDANVATQTLELPASKSCWNVPAATRLGC
ncbi:MAG: hypothetical protein ABTS22_19550 [Accumulibacter sp.]|uniref:hypothetical protein n=1 Tax=Accumulibacter sp. TaxID=2053492 RepID=UPI0033157E49